MWNYQFPVCRDLRTNRQDVGHTISDESATSVLLHQSWTSRLYQQMKSFLMYSMELLSRGSVFRSILLFQLRWCFCASETSLLPPQSKQPANDSNQTAVQNHNLHPTTVHIFSDLPSHFHFFLHNHVEKINRSAEKTWSSIKVFLVKFVDQRRLSV